MVVDRREMKDVIARFLRFGGATAAPPPVAPPPREAVAASGDEPAR
jgi:hypothetical protein